MVDLLKKKGSYDITILPSSDLKRDELSQLCMVGGFFYVVIMFLFLLCFHVTPLPVA